MPETFFSELIANITQRGRALFPRQTQIRLVGQRHDIVKLCSVLLSGRGEASGVALAAEIVRIWDDLDSEGKKQFLLSLVRDFGYSVSQLEAAITDWNLKRDETTVRRIHAAAEPRRQELIRRLNLAPGGTQRLVSMREELFRHRKEHPELEVLDADFLHLFSSWFNRGFLVLKRIDWNTSALILEKIIRYEAVHAIDDWTELRRRIDPEDRRLFAFFHPQMPDEPLIFVEVALTTEIPAGIRPVLDPERASFCAAAATTAVFYSISNCQDGLKGVSFGNFLIKQVVEDLKRELPNLNRFVTLSPVPGFRKWLEKRQNEPDVLHAVTQTEGFDASSPSANEGSQSSIFQTIERCAAEYLLKAKDGRGKPLDPVARFHLGNGARLERLNPFGDPSPNGLKQSYGLMVNYLYDPNSIEGNHEAFAERGEVIVSEAIRKKLRQKTPSGFSKSAPPVQSGTRQRQPNR